MDATPVAMEATIMCTTVPIEAATTTISTLMMLVITPLIKLKCSLDQQKSGYFLSLFLSANFGTKNTRIPKTNEISLWSLKSDEKAWTEIIQILGQKIPVSNDFLLVRITLPINNITTMFGPPTTMWWSTKQLQRLTERTTTILLPVSNSRGIINNKAATNSINKPTASIIRVVISMGTRCIDSPSSN